MIPRAKSITGRMLEGIGRVDVRYILLSAFLLRMLFYIVVYENFADEYGWRSDDNYDEIARNVLAGEGYRVSDTAPPNTVRAPFYTLFLVLIYAVLGEERWKVVLAQALLQTLACWILYRLARKTTNSEIVAKTASVLFAVYPQSMLYCSMFLTESLFSLLTILTAYAYLEFYTKQGVKRATLLGILFGASALTKPVALALVLPLLAWSVITRTDAPRRARLVSSFWVIALFLLTLTPWTLRNYFITGTIIPVTSRGGHFFYSNTITGREEEIADQVRQFGRADEDDPAGRDMTYLRMALLNIAEKPHLFVKNTFMTVLDFWYRGHSRSISIFNALVNFTLLFPGVLGMMHYRRFRGAMLAPLLIFVLYYNVCYGLLHAISRYSFPVIVFVMLFASYYLSRAALGASHAEF